MKRTTFFLTGIIKQLKNDLEKKESTRTGELAIFLQKYEKDIITEAYITLQVYQKPLNEQLKFWRRRAGLKKHQMAKNIGASLQTYRQMESEAQVNSPSIKHYKKAAEVLNVYLSI